MIDGNKLIEAIQKLQQGGSQPVAAPVKGKTHVVIVLDSSGSMESIRDDIIGAYNANNTSIRDGAKASGTETFVTLVLFGESGTPVRVAFEHQPVDTLEDLTRATYVPQSGTPMYDGIGCAISTVQRHLTNEDNEAVLVNIFTDGQENASREWSGLMLSTKIKELQATNTWTFTVAGANIDLGALANTLNIPAMNMQQFKADSHGTQVLSHQHGHANVNYFAARGKGMTQSAAFYGDTELGGNHGVNPTYPLGQPVQPISTLPPVSQNVQDLLKILNDTDARTVKTPKADRRGKTKRSKTPSLA